jgi:GT2 family glycosyltransferase
MMVKTAIVILNWNGLEFLKTFLGIAVKNSASPGTVVYVVDNGSSDGSADWVAESFPSVLLIKSDKNLGFAGGYNFATQQIDAQYFILLNSDIEVTEGWTEPLVSFMEKNVSVASCQPKILSWNNRENFEYAGAAGGYMDKYGYPFCRGRLFHSIEKDEGQYDTVKEVFWTSGACMIVRAEAWRRCGGFDSDFFAHMEEIDLCWRFHLAGYRVCFIPESLVYHVGGGALPYNSPFKTYLNFRNNLFLLYKNLPDKKLHSVLFIRKLLDGIAAISFLISGKTENIKSLWNAHVDYYRSIKSLKEKRESVKRLSVKQSVNLILNKSIVFEFYIKGKRTFSELKTNI